MDIEVGIYAPVLGVIIVANYAVMLMIERNQSRLELENSKNELIQYNIEKRFLHLENGYPKEKLQEVHLPSHDEVVKFHEDKIVFLEHFETLENTATNSGFEKPTHKFKTFLMSGAKNALMTNLIDQDGKSKIQKNTIVGMMIEKTFQKEYI